MRTFFRIPPALRLSAIVIMLVTLVAPAHIASAQGNRLCFTIPGITNCIEGRFREFWEQNGGLPVFGYPITAPANTRTAEGTFLTQVFERNTFELHPEKARPYDVLLGRLGDMLMRNQGTNWQNLPKAAPSAPHYFPETGHAVAHEPFWQYWSSRGLQDPALNPHQRSLALFGLPLTEPFTARNPNGDTVLMQWFERARFEWHPNNPPQYRVLLGLLGNELGPIPVQPGPAPQPGPQITVEGPRPDEYVRSPFRLRGRISQYPNDGELAYRLTDDDDNELAESYFDVRRSGSGATFDIAVSFREPADAEGLELEVTERNDDGRVSVRAVVPLRFDPEEFGRQEITIDSPDEDDEVSSPFRLRGSTLRAPVGGVLYYRLRDDDGNRIAEGQFPVRRSGVGATFDVQIRFPEPLDQEILDLSVEERNRDGERLARSTVRLEFDP